MPTSIHIQQLHIHPFHEQIFGPPDPAEIKRLASDIKTNQLNHPLDVTPDLQIVGGRKRYLALQQLAWQEVPVHIRQELTCEASIRRFIIRDNFIRHDNTPLERARCAQQLKELALNGSFDDLPQWKQNSAQKKLAQQIGEMLGIGRRQVDRLLRVLETPLSVQRAFEQGLPIKLAESVAGLASQIQAQIALEIEQGGDPREVIQRHVQTSANRPKGPTEAYRRLLQRLAAMGEALEGCQGQIATSADGYQDHLRILQQTQAWLDRLIEMDHQGQQAREAAQARILRQFQGGMS